MVTYEYCDKSYAILNAILPAERSDYNQGNHLYFKLISTQGYSAARSSSGAGARDENGRRRSNMNLQPTQTVN
jgi:hypothetical protein